MNIISKFLFFLTMLFSIQAFSIEKMEENWYDENERETVLRCKITHSDKHHHLPKPKKFHRSNNLTRQSKDVFFSKGESMIIEGYILDKNCVPITNTSIQLWQPNYYGFNQDGIKAKNISKNLGELNYYDPHFASNGSNSSDNTGFYRFILIKPGECNENKIDISVRHKKFSPIEKVVWIGKRDNSDTTNTANNSSSKQYFGYELQKICGCDVENINGKKIISINTGGSVAKYIGKRDDQDVYRFDIVLSGREQYKKY